MEYVLRYKNIIISLLIVFLFYTVIKKIVIHFELETANVAQLYEEAEKGEEAIKKWEKYSAEHKALKKVFLDDNDLVFKPFIENTAKRLKIRVTSFRTSREETELYGSLATTLSIICTYDKLLQFLKIIEAKSIGVERIEINKNNEGEVVRSDITLRSFTLKELK